MKASGCCAVINISGRYINRERSTIKITHEWPAQCYPATATPQCPGNSSTSESSRGDVNDTAVIFVTDGGYLAPSVHAAKQILAQGIGATADVLIFTIDVDEAITQAVERSIAHPAFRFLPMQSKSFVPPEGTPFFKNHVPIAALARLALEPEIPAQYRRLVYLDGDIQVVGDLRPLIGHVVPEGRILAGRGSSWLDMDDEFNVVPPGYLEALGGVSKVDYFNSGVLAFSRETWAEYAPMALQRFFDNALAFVRHDQSALNSVFKDRVDYFSPAYNFHWYYANAYAQRFLKPRIIHFTGSWKPWKSISPPWGPGFYRTYTRLLHEHPELRELFPVKALPPERLAKELVRYPMEAVRLVRERTVLAERRAMIRDYVDNGDLALR